MQAIRVMYNFVCSLMLIKYSYIGGKVMGISSGVGPILMSHLYCNGNEQSLLDCSHQSCYVSQCTSPDAGVACESNDSIILLFQL